MKMKYRRRNEVPGKRTFRVKGAVLKYAVRGLLCLFLFSLPACQDIMKCDTLRSALDQDSSEKLRALNEGISELEKEKERSTLAQRKLSTLYYQLGEYQLEKKMWDKAIEAFDKAVKNGYRYERVYYSIGVAYANRGKDAGSSDDLNRAKQNYERSISINSRFYDARYALAILLFYELEKKDEAVEVIELLVKEHPKFYIARFAAARFYYELDKPEKALDMYERLDADLSRLPESADVNEYRKNCRENINRLISELPRRVGR